MARLLPDIAAAAGLTLMRNKIVFAQDGAAGVPAEKGAQLVVVADPNDAQGWGRAVAAQAGGAKIWALIEPGGRAAPFPVCNPMSARSKN